VLAHPTIVHPGGQLIDARWLGALVAAGLDGVEVYHHRLDEAALAHFLALAREYDLTVTGGSDLHGWYTGLAQMDGRSAPITLLEDLKARKNGK
jgi:predicted metal-dependent phosphoesterase TrpH